MLKFKRLVKGFLTQFGYDLIRTDSGRLEDRHNMQSALLRLSQLNINPKVIVDIGAAKGTWTKQALKYWPEAEYYLIEPVAEQIAAISPILKNAKNITIVEAVAGDRQGKVQINITPDLDGSGIYDNEDDISREVSVTTIDKLLEKNQGPFVLKFDTHGYEIPIFDGAKKVIDRTEAIIIEVYGFHVSPTGKLFHEISSFLMGKGFRLYDMVDMMRRPKDNAFWQVDAIYLRDSNPIFHSKIYSN